ncbi:MAG: hypothetical protein A4E40_00973 [Methanoregulaceae archaeon PtaU1.Bin059]|nr:MAG: hypothetical protein A4E40_00973 [Methanoregulaceae archaeon PtaU1.Bin059]
MMLYRGPQFTHEVPQYPEYLPEGSWMSPRHSSQTAMSGGIMPERVPLSLAWMEKSSGNGPDSGNTSTWSMRESGGPRETCARNSSNRSPEAWISTSLPRFFTNPLIPSAIAVAYTNGRKPTPWTIPLIFTLPLLRMPFKQRFIDLSRHIILGFYQ